eukprot:NODE_35158_length_181_cov_1.515152_g33988_i0.p4 GENE.NODE_35158_length_181_cov_1.515152_g33988_i0~~NODE_35158_length_181_cov_1.515152_g33988_i0.p4  ORF type:complete len:53 (-),score=3.13 NODE_35158_length_181_cov_1.515152_g33988_i0:7-165(-)
MPTPLAPPPPPGALKVPAPNADGGEGSSVIPASVPWRSVYHGGRGSKIPLPT